MTDASSTNVKVAWIGVVGVVLAALIGAGSLMLKKEKASSPASTSSSSQTSYEESSPNIQGVEGNITINIKNNKNSE